VRGVAFRRLLPVIQLAIFIAFYAMTSAQERQRSAETKAREAKWRYEDVKAGRTQRDEPIEWIDTAGWHPPVPLAMQMAIGSFMPAALPAVACGLTVVTIAEAFAPKLNELPIISLFVLPAIQLVMMFRIGLACDSAAGKLPKRRRQLEGGVGIYLLLSSSFGAFVASRGGVPIIAAWTLIWILLGFVLVKSSRKATAPA
jgi:hypothetical protein